MPLSRYHFLKILRHINADIHKEIPGFSKSFSLTTFIFFPRVYEVGLDRIEPSITVHEQSADILNLTWNTDGFPSPDSTAQEDIAIDILLYFYEESATTGLVQLAPASRIQSGIKLANGQIFLKLMDISAEVTSGRGVGIFRITEAGVVDTTVTNR